MRGLIVALASGLIGCLAASPAHALAETRPTGLSSHDLWRVVSYLCVPSASLGLPLPCTTVHEGGTGDPGWAILPVTRGHILTVPTRRISGVESPEFLHPESRGYWQAAWSARGILDDDFGRKLDRSDVALAVNSRHGRSQDQLHIHTACLKQSVKAALLAEKSRIGSSWVRLRAVMEGSRYQAVRLNAESLAGTNVAELLPEPVRRDPAAMARQTLVVVGATFESGAPGFIVLNDQSVNGSKGHGEGLLDFGCRR